MTHFPGSDTLDNMASFQGIHYHAIHFFLSFIHFHFTFVGKYLPTITTFANALSGISQLFCANFVNLEGKSVNRGKPIFIVRVVLTLGHRGCDFAWDPVPKSSETFTVSGRTVKLDVLICDCCVWYFSFTLSCLSSSILSKPDSTASKNSSSGRVEWGPSCGLNVFYLSLCGFLFVMSFACLIDIIYFWYYIKYMDLVVWSMVYTKFVSIVWRE